MSESILDKLHIEESGYRLEVTTIVSEIQGENGLLDRDTSDILNDVKQAVYNHEYFDGFNGAIYGEIVEYTNAEPGAICNYEIESNPEDVLKEMAKECMVRDVMIQIEEVQQ